MCQGAALPIVHTDTPVPEALVEMSSKGMGMTIVVNDEQLPVGIFTDGDLRRLIAKHGDIRPLTVAQGMSRDPKTVAPGALAIEAATLMRSEEHTSELQSLMRISYAVFCLTKKNYTIE